MDKDTEAATKSLMYRLIRESQYSQPHKDLLIDYFKGLLKEQTSHLKAVDSCPLCKSKRLKFDTHKKIIKGEVAVVLEARCKECIWASIMEIQSFDLLKFGSVGADDFGLYEYHIKGVAKKLSEEDMMIVLGLNQLGQTEEG